MAASTQFKPGVGLQVLPEGASVPNTYPAIVLLDPTTGLPADFSGGGGNAAVDFEIMAVQDSTDAYGLMRVDDAGVITYTTLTGAAWVPTGAVRPWAPTLAIGAATSAKQDTLIANIGTTGDAVATNWTGAWSLNSLTRLVANLISSLRGQLPGTLGAKTSSVSLSVVSATDDPAAVALGAPADAAATTDGGAFSITAILKRVNTYLAGLRVQLPSTIGQKTTTTALGVVLASDDPLVVAVGTPADTQAGNDTAPWSVIAMLKRLGGILSAMTVKLPATIGAKAGSGSLSVVPATDANVAREIYTATIVSQATSGSNGATYVAFASQACTALEIVNTGSTAVDIEYQRSGATAAGIVIPAGYSRLIDGITNASQIAIRRRDQTATAVTVMAEARVAA